MNEWLSFICTPPILNSYQFSNLPVLGIVLGLSGGLSFNDLRITQETGATLVEIATSGEDLVRLSWVQASSLNANSFVII